MSSFIFILLNIISLFFALAIEVIREMDDMFDEGKEGENVITYLFQ